MSSVDADEEDGTFWDENEATPTPMLPPSSGKSNIRMVTMFCWICLLQRRRSRWETKGKTDEMISFSVHMSDNHTCKEWNQKTEQQLGDTGAKDATKQASLQAGEYIQDVY